MPLSSLLQLLVNHAAEHSYGVPAIQRHNLEQSTPSGGGARDSKPGDIAKPSAGDPQVLREPYLVTCGAGRVESHPAIPWFYIRTRGQAQPVCTQSSFWIYHGMMTARSRRTQIRPAQLRLQH